jgi:hypothetical protein
MRFKQNKVLRLIVSGVLIGAYPLMAEPITGVTGWFHHAMTQAGTDLVPAFVIIGALFGAFRGWMGMLAGAALGLVLAIIVANADAIGSFGHSVPLT